MDGNQVIYFDAPKEECVGVIWKGRQVVYTGGSVHQEPAAYRGVKELEPFLRVDFHFFFEDEKPGVEIYAVPELLILGYDSAGGYFAATRSDAGFTENFPLFYLSKEMKLYAVEGGSSQLFAGTWRDKLQPSDAVKVYPSRAMAERDFVIHDLSELHLPGLSGEAE